YAKQKQQHLLAKIIGYADDYASLHFSGVWIHKDGQRLYPAPLNLMYQNTSQQDNKRCFFLQIDSELTQTDLGTIHLPKLSPDDAGSKNLENIWLSKANYEQVLNGIPPAPEDWFILKSPSQRQQNNSLLIEEPRIGIARDNKRRNVKKGRLYQTKHIRFSDGVSLCMDVSIDQQYKAISEQADNHFFTRLGGEGRLASITQHAVPDALDAPDIGKYFVIYLLSPLLITASEQNQWQPLPEFVQDIEKEPNIWKGVLNGISLTLHSAVVGKAHREGGWDLVKHQPKPIKPYLPAGSVFYCSSDVESQDIIKALHNQQIGSEQTLGRGKIALGKWVQTEQGITS
ncbi:MAG: hypothetical protein KAG86_07400, partial [Gammaproteobacteria bacterium]|nr:hypothetical protein [Gammaproteobacteria bacterium]